MPALPLPAAALLALAALLAAPPAPAQDQAQAWTYVSYKRDPASGRFAADLGNTGRLELHERGGQAFVRIVAGTLDACHRGDLPVAVERAEGRLTLTPTALLSGCSPMRWVIREDGSGGSKEIRRGERWADDGFDHGLRRER